MELDYTITEWLEKLEDGKLPRGKDEQVEAFMLLLKTLKEEHGYEKGGLSLVRSKVLIACTNPNSKKLATWKNILEKHFNIAVTRIWPSTFVELTEEEKNPTKFKLTQASKPDKVEEEVEEVPRYGKELNRAIFDKTPVPEVQVDEELSEMLGFDSDE